MLARRCRLARRRPKRSRPVTVAVASLSSREDRLLTCAGACCWWTGASTLPIRRMLWLRLSMSWTIRKRCFSRRATAARTSTPPASAWANRAAAAWPSSTCSSRIARTSYGIRSMAARSTRNVASRSPSSKTSPNWRAAARRSRVRTSTTRFVVSRPAPRRCAS